MELGFEVFRKEMLTLSNLLEYLINLENWLCLNNYFGAKRSVLILDNCSSHRAAIVKEYLQKSKWIVYFLPPYSPQLAPVVIAFNCIKMGIKKNYKFKTLKITKNDKFRYARMTIEPLHKAEIIGIYKILLR